MNHNTSGSPPFVLGVLERGVDFDCSGPSHAGWKVETGPERAEGLFHVLLFAKVIDSTVYLISKDCQEIGSYMPWKHVVSDATCLEGKIS